MTQKPYSRTIGRLARALALAVPGSSERGSGRTRELEVPCTPGAFGVLAELLPLISHADWSVRAEAICALAERRVVRAAPAILGLLDGERDEPPLTIPPSHRLPPPPANHPVPVVTHRARPVLTMPSRAARINNPVPTHPMQSHTRH